MQDYATELPGGKHWSLTMRRGRQLTITDIAGDANVGMLFYNPQNLLERYNAPDTLKCQHTFYLTTGHCLYSDMGRIFCSIIQDDLGWHDTVCGTSSREQIESKWGKSDYQTARNDYHQNGRDSFLVEAAKYGLGKRDMAANVNWFSKVAVDGNGAMRYAVRHSRPGNSLTLRFEMDTLVLLHTCPHPLNPSESYPANPVHFAIATAPPVTENDVCYNASPANPRGFANNNIYHQCTGGH